jgi:hypothetical protein
MAAPSACAGDANLRRAETLAPVPPAEGSAGRSSMIAYIQLWNQTLWPWMEQADEARITRAGATFIGRWSCGIRRHYGVDARVFIYRVRDHHGIVASGYVLDEPRLEEDFDGSGRVWWYLPIEFDVVLDPNDILPRDRLEAEVPFDWRHMMGSGIKVSGEAAAKLEDLWRRHLVSVGRTSDAAI